MTRVQEGDILLYWRVNPSYSVSERLIQAGEILETGSHEHEYYHVAIAIDETRKIEAISGYPVAIKELLQTNDFDVYRPPWSIEQKSVGLSKVRADIGQKYDMWLNIDDGLRYLTRNWIHLPVLFVYDRERLAKNCVSLLRVYLKGAKSGIRLPLNASPMDAGLALHKYRVDR